MYTSKELVTKQRKRAWLYLILLIILLVLIGISIPKIQVPLAQFATPFLSIFFKTVYPEKYYTKQQKRCQFFAFVFGFCCIALIISKSPDYYPELANKKIENLYEAFILFISLIGCMALFTVIGYQIAKYVAKRFFMENDPYFK